MASISANGSRGHHKFTLNISETSVDTANNKSTVTWSFVLSPVQTGWDWNYSSQIPVKYSVKINGTEYTGNIMSYNGSSTVTIRSGTQDVTHNNDGSKSIEYSFSVWDNVSASYLPGSASASDSMSLTTIKRYATITKFDLSSGLENISVSWNTDVTCDEIQYKLNNNNWVATSGKTFNIAGLSPNTSYNVKIKVKREGTTLWTESSIKSIATKNKATISSAPNINFGDTASVSISNPSGTTKNLRVETLNPTTTIATRNNVGNSVTITFTDIEWDNFYKKLGNNNSMTIRYVVDTIGNSTYNSYVDKTLTLTGNQKTIRTKVSGSWHRGKIWIKVNGSWKKAVVWTKINGTWRRAI